MKSAGALSPAQAATPPAGERSNPRRLLVVSHCVLNQNAVVQPLARSRGVMTSAARWAIESGYELFQLPCPEFRFAGPHRAPASFDDYNTDGFHSSNRELLAPVIRELLRFQREGYEIVGSLHVQDSPACDPDTGNWITDFLAAAQQAGIAIRQMWQIPSTPTGHFDPEGPQTNFGSPAKRQIYPEDATTVTPEQRRQVLLCGPRIPVHQRTEGVG